MTNRMLRHYVQMAHTEIENSNLTQIFSKIMSLMSKFSPEINTIQQSIVTATVDVYRKVLTKLLPTPSKSHYTFNLRDLSSVFQGLLGANPKTVTDPAFRARGSSPLTRSVRASSVVTTIRSPSAPSVKKRLSGSTAAVAVTRTRSRPAGFPRELR